MREYGPNARLGFELDRFFGVWPSEVQMQVAKCDLGGCDWFFMARLVCCVCKVLKVQCRVFESTRFCWLAGFMSC
jgi:hypothetical protein